MWERGSKYNDGTPEIHASSIGKQWSSFLRIDSIKFNSYFFPTISYALMMEIVTVGIAKSALEAINGCNLFGEKGASWSVVYVDIDAHNRNRSIFETMLPRESSSKVFAICYI